MSIGIALRRLIARSGLSQTEVAQAMGYKRASSIQRYIDDGFGAEKNDTLKLELATKFAHALVGKGDPPVTNEDVFGLSGVELTDRNTLRATNFLGIMELGQQEYPTEVDRSQDGLPFSRRDVFQMPKDLPAYGTALGGSLRFISPDNHDVAIEQTDMRAGDILEHFRRPPHLIGNKEAHVLYLQGSSMEPKFEDGEAILVDPRRPVKARDYVVVTLRRQECPDSDPEVAAVLVKRLVRRTGEFVDLEQFTPPIVFRVPSSKIMRIAPVIPWGDAMGF